MCGGKEGRGVFTWRQQGRLIRKSSLLANGFLERRRCHLTEKYLLLEPAHPLQCIAALCESTAVPALSSLCWFLSCSPQTLSLLPAYLPLFPRSWSLSSLPVSLCSLSILFLCDSVPYAEIGSVTGSGSITKSPGKIFFLWFTHFALRCYNLSARSPASTNWFLNISTFSLLFCYDECDVGIWGPVGAKLFHTFVRLPDVVLMLVQEWHLQISDCNDTRMMRSACDKDTIEKRREEKWQVEKCSPADQNWWWEVS